MESINTSVVEGIAFGIACSDVGFGTLDPGSSHVFDGSGVANEPIGDGSDSKDQD